MINLVGYYLGTSHAELGDSGSAIVDSNGYFLGISIGKKDFAFTDIKNMKIEDIADHHPDTQIISSDSILGYLGIIDSDVSSFSWRTILIVMFQFKPPPEKKFAPETE